MVLLSACPICSEPVTLGGGMTMVNGSAPGLAPAPAAEGVGVEPGLIDAALRPRQVRRSFRAWVRPAATARRTKCPAGASRG